eukprot:COSAG02_NODE_97_length_37159_cov_37.660335_12_plen_63_part_00
MQKARSREFIIPASTVCLVYPASIELFRTVEALSSASSQVAEEPIDVTVSDGIPSWRVQQHN